MKPSTRRGSLHRTFTTFAHSFQEMSPEVRRSLMIASVISTFSLVLIGAATLYTWRAGEPVPESIVPPAQVASQPSVQPDPSGLEVEGVSRVSVVPVAAFQPVTPASNPPGTPSAVLPSAAPSPIPLQTVRPQVAPSADPIRPVHKRSLYRQTHRGTGRKAMSDEYIRSYLSRQFPKKVPALTPADQHPSSYHPPVNRTPVQYTAAPSRTTFGPVSSRSPRQGRIPVAKATQVPVGSRYAIQLGYYTNRAYAKQYAAQLAQQGLQPYLVATRVNGPVRVFVGRYGSENDARVAFRQLPAGVSEGMIVKTNW